MPYIDFCNIKILQDDEGSWWLEYYLDDIRYGVSLADIHAAQQSVQSDGSLASLFSESDTATLVRGDERLTIRRR